MSDHSRPDGRVDEHLTARLHEPVPDRVLQRSRDLGAWLSVDRELAALVGEQPVGAGVRAPESTVSFTFESAHWVIEVELARETRDVTGQLLPPTTATVTLHSTLGAEATTSSDAHGVFRLGNVPAGRVCLTIESVADDRMSVRTDFFDV